MASLHTSGLEQPPKVKFGYDALNRLTEFLDGPTGVVIEKYSYDATGNRTSFANANGTERYAYPGGSHRLAAVGSTPRSYDATGNTTSIGGAAREFAYNAAGRMSRVERDNVVAMSYAYNGKGEQVRKHRATSSNHAIYDEAGNWIGDYGTSGAPVHHVIWLEDLPVGLIANAELNFIEPDHLGTPRTIIEPKRDIAVWAWDLASEAFGNSAPSQDPDADAVPFVFNMRFPGQRFDPASGLNYNYFRDGFDTDSGRYSQPDPIGLNGGSGVYVYAGGSPVMAVDPLGLKTCLLTTVALGGVRDHAAVFTSRGDGSGGPALFDPAGAYGAANGGGSSGLVLGSAADIRKFQAFHEGQATESVCIETSKQEEESIIKNAMDLPSAAPFECSVMSSTALSGHPSFPHVEAGTFWPGNLRRQVQRGDR